MLTTVSIVIVPSTCLQAAIRFPRQLNVRHFLLRRSFVLIVLPVNIMLRDALARIHVVFVVRGTIHRFVNKHLEPSLTTNVIGSSVVHPVIIVNVNGRKFRALLDSGASHSYVSSTLIELINAHAVKCGTRRVATLLGVTTTRLLEYDLCLRAVKGDFALNTRVTRINKK